MLLINKVNSFIRSLDIIMNSCADRVSSKRNISRKDVKIFGRISRKCDQRKFRKMRKFLEMRKFPENEKIL